LRRIGLLAWACIASAAPLIAQGSGGAYTQLYTGAYYSWALRNDGALYTWGRNTDGQLGLGSTSNAVLLPVALAAPAGKTWAQVAGSEKHTLGVTTDGTLYSWGQNASGVLGDGTTQNRLQPGTVPLAAGAVAQQAAAGRSHSLLLLANGSVLSWGAGNLGQLGTGSTSGSQTPVPVTGLPACTQVVASNDFSLAVAATDGAIWAWGLNNSGQLGDGTVQQRLAPVRVAPPAGLRWTQVAAGLQHSLALASDGAVWAWGSNQLNQLGDGTSTARLAPVRIAPPAGLTFTAVAAGNYFSMALCSDGSLYSWGEGGVLGNGAAQGRSTPGRVAPPTGQTWTRIATGQYHALALTSAGQVYATGDNTAGQLGNGNQNHALSFVRLQSLPLPSRAAAVVTQAIYPNPARERLYWAGAPAQGTLTLVDVNGRVLRRAVSSEALELGDIKAGLYLVQLHTPGAPMRTARVVVE
jgi:alpha-tubulin suppressor-like RCC1 family protein